jgi:uncharacterized protein YwgA
MDAIALPLMLASDLARTSGEAFPFDRLRMQKAVFLLVQRGSDAWHELYDYMPYDWGPYSGKVTQDVESLRSRQLLTVQQVQGARYGRFATTPAGEALASSFWQQLKDPEREFIRRVRAYVTSRSFNGLLREVYAAYPEFATESRFRG